MLSLALAAWLASTPGATTPSPAPAQRFHGLLEVGGSLVEAAASVAVEAGFAVGAPRLVLRAEWNPWFSLQQRPSFLPGTFNLGAGVELRHFDGRLVSVFLAGASVLLFRSAFDAPGTAGPFVSLQPATFRFALGSFHLRFCPLSMLVLAPSLNTIPLVTVQFRTSVSLER